MGGCRDHRLFYLELQESIVTHETRILRELICVVDHAKLMHSP